MSPSYRLVQTFRRLEAIGSDPFNPSARGGARNELADPVRLQLRLTLAGDPTQIVEERDAQSVPDRIYRVSTGVWAYALPVAALQPSQMYTANFRYQMMGGNLQVVRQNFTFAPVPERAKQPNHCVLFGLLAGVDGLPFANERVVIEQYRDVLALNARVGTAEVRSDPFGYWWMELPVGTIVRIVLGELTKVIAVPNLDRAALAAIESYQPAAPTNVDSFGYPKP